MNPPALFPGTRVRVSEIGLLTGIFSATNGITLSQVCEITGVESSTIQNWVKRGYVPKPEQRRYTKRHLARIIIINMLRDTLPIEKIARVLSYVNGNLLDTSDDIMDDSEIYEHLCKVIIPIDTNGIVDLKDLSAKVDHHLRDYKGPRPDAKERLSLVLKATICAYESACLKRFAEQLTCHI